MVHVDNRYGDLSVFGAEQNPSDKAVRSGWRWRKNRNVANAFFFLRSRCFKFIFNYNLCLNFTDSYNFTRNHKSYINKL